MVQFTVIIATYNRGEHILPTLVSALDQTHKDFEILIVGDCCTDVTENVVQPYLNERVSWVNLPVRGGSQTYPNNKGITLARGEFIAYLGHDDIWMPNHLEELARTFAGAHRPDFAVSGCICHTPMGSRFAWVAGLFDEPAAANGNFFPPTSLAHRSDIVDTIGMWRDPEEISTPVDEDLQIRAVMAGLTFISTGYITVHKFAAGHRYLSYLRPTSSEQVELLRLADDKDFALYVDRIVDEAKRVGTFMTLRNRSHEKSAKGDVYRHNAQIKGIIKPELKQLTGSATIEQGNDPRAFDWHPAGAVHAELRWSGPNPRPKVLIPFCGGNLVACAMVFVHEDRNVLKGVRIWCDGQLLPSSCVAIEAHDEGEAVHVTIMMRLEHDDYTVLEIEQPDSALTVGENGARVGVAMGDIDLRPAKWHEVFRDNVARYVRALKR